MVNPHSNAGDRFRNGGYKNSSKKKWQAIVKKLFYSFDKNGFPKELKSITSVNYLFPFLRSLLFP